MVRKYLYAMYLKDNTERIITETKDGSHTIVISGSSLSYHSMYGAIQESLHIFIQMGLIPTLELYDTVNIFEMGMGTGLNVLLSAVFGFEKKTACINYTTIETDPLEENIVLKLNYPEKLSVPAAHSVFTLIHECEWEIENSITDRFTLTKRKIDLLGFTSQARFHLVYFDAFAPDEQPQLWTTDVFKNIFEMMFPGGLLVTYSSKGTVRRALNKAGFIVEKLPGPPGKKEMVRAKKPH